MDLYRILFEKCQRRRRGSGPGMVKRTVKTSTSIKKAWLRPAASNKWREEIWSHVWRKMLTYLYNSSLSHYSNRYPGLVCVWFFKMGTKELQYLIAPCFENHSISVTRWWRIRFLGLEKKRTWLKNFSLNKFTEKYANICKIKKYSMDIYFRNLIFCS